LENIVIGIESYFFNFILSSVFLIYIYLFYPIVKRSFKTKNKNRFNSLFTLIMLLSISVLNILPLADTGLYLFMPLNFYILVFCAFWTLLSLFSALFQNTSEYEIEKNESLISGLENQHRDKQEIFNFSFTKEAKRKVLHFLAILYIACWSVQPIIFWAVYNFLYPGVINVITVEEYNNIRLFSSEDYFLENGVLLQLFVLFCTFFVSADAELLRLRFPKYKFPFKKTLQTTRRATEVLDISAHVHIMLSLALSTLILTFSSLDRIAGIWAQMGVIAISALGDLSAALIGRKYGKHRWPIHKGKTIEGSIGGFLVSFFCSIIFVGPILALIGGLIFIFTDLFLSKLGISDNIANPLILAITFKVLIFLVNPLIVSIPYIKIW
jgi:dolichol kinase